MKSLKRRRPSKEPVIWGMWIFWKVNLVDNMLVWENHLLCSQFFNKSFSIHFFYQSPLYLDNNIYVCAHNISKISERFVHNISSPLTSPQVQWRPNPFSLSATTASSWNTLDSWKDLMIRLSKTEGGTLPLQQTVILFSSDFKHPFVCT